MSPLEFVKRFLLQKMISSEEIFYLFELFKNSEVLNLIIIKKANKIIEALFSDDQFENYMILELLQHGPNIAFELREGQLQDKKQHILKSYSVLQGQEPLQVFKEIQKINGYCNFREVKEEELVQQLLIFFQNMKLEQYKYGRQVSICRIKYPKQITKQPNQDIVIGKMTDSQLPIDSQYKVFYNYAHTYKIKQLQRWNLKIYQEPQQITYEGSLNLQGLEQSKNGMLRLGDTITYQGQFQEGVFQGKGKLTTQYGYLKGDFNNGYAHGKCQDEYGQGSYYYNQKHGEYKDNYNRVYFYEDGQQVQYEVKSRDIKTVLYVANQNQNYIDNFCLRTLLPNQWLQMKIVDYYLDAMQQQQMIQTIKIINTCQAQDIFGSLIEKHQYSKEITINHQQYNRIILVININRSHFITIAYENQKFYIYDSLASYYDDLIYNMHQVLGLDESNTEIINAKNINQLRQDNSYDCGLHAIFNAYKLYTNAKIQDIKFAPKIDMKNVRKQIKSIVEDNYTSLSIL